MTARTIVVTGGATPSAYLHDLLGGRPRVAYLPTAGGDGSEYVAGMTERFPADRFEPASVSLFRRTIADLRSFLLSRDLVWVCGGNTANLLAIWRVHGVDDILRECWDAGVVLAGASAGALCWFHGGPTDSFDKSRLAVLRDGLGLLPGSHCAHWSGEPQRKPFYRELIAGGFPAGIAVDDDCVVRFDGTDVAEVRPLAEGAGAWRVELAGGDVTETALG